MVAAVLAGAALALIDSSLFVAWLSAIPGEGEGGVEEPIGRALDIATVLLFAGVSVLVSLLGGLLGYGIDRWRGIRTPPPEGRR